MHVIILCFWVSVAVLGYSYLGYPALMWLWARLRPRPSAPVPCQPRLSVVIVAYNEAHQIERRIRDLLAQDYPAEHREIIVASDGSRDDTAARARRVRSPGVRVVEFTVRRGKSAVLDEVIPWAHGDVVVLTDARQHFAPGALRMLTAQFSDPEVGAVGGELVLMDGPAGSEVVRGVDAYWRYEKFIRRHESLVDSTVGASGSIYALRRVLFRTIPADIILDDVLVPMSIARQGYRVLFEPRARAYDRIAPSAQAEFRRKVRTLAGNFQLLLRARWLWNPRANRLWLQTISHKLCRLLCPGFLALALVCNLLLWPLPGYRTLLALQLAFYAAALGGHYLRKSGNRLLLLNVPYAFCLLNWATVMGLVEFLNGRQRATWEIAGMASAIGGGPVREWRQPET